MTVEPIAEAVAKLRAYLSMTNDEYSRWVESGVLPDDSPFRDFDLEGVANG